MSIRKTDLSLGIPLGFYLGLLGMLWPFQSTLKQEFESAQKKIVSLLASEQFTPNLKDYASYSFSIIHHFQHQATIVYAILIGMCIQKHVIFYELGKDADSSVEELLNQIPDTIIEDKKAFSDFLMSIAKEYSDFDDLIQKVDQYLNPSPEVTQTTSTVSATSKEYVFISYTSHDRQYADTTRRLLQQEGISVWMAPYDIPAGSKYARVINDAIEDCCCVLLLLTKEAQTSVFVEREIERAVTYRKSVVSMNLDECELNSTFKFLIGCEQIIPVKSLDSDSYEFLKVIDGIKSNFTIQPSPSTVDLQTRYWAFIANIKVSDYERVKKTIQAEKETNIEGSLFDLLDEICRTNPYDMTFQYSRLSLIVLYHLAQEYQYDDICQAMKSDLPDIKQATHDELVELATRSIELNPSFFEMLTKLGDSEQRALSNSLQLLHDICCL